jgi:hypothetical protein
VRHTIREADAGVKAAQMPAIVAAKKAAVDLDDTMTQVNLQSALASIGAPAVPHLVPDLTNATRDLRWGAATGLAMMGPAAKEALPALRAAAKTEKDQTVADQINQAIGRVEGS